MDRDRRSRRRGEEGEGYPGSTQAESREWGDDSEKQMKPRRGKQPKSSEDEDQDDGALVQILRLSDPDHIWHSQLPQIN